jgi:hypothetical protein
MALRMGALYDALQQAPGITEDAARAAAEEVAAHYHRPAAIEAKITLLTWMVGTHLALTVAMMLWISTQLGTIQGQLATIRQELAGLKATITIQEQK